MRPYAQTVPTMGTASAGCVVLPSLTAYGSAPASVKGAEKGLYFCTGLGCLHTLYDMEAITKQIKLPACIPLTAAPTNCRTVAIAMLAFEDTLC